MILPLAFTREAEETFEAISILIEEKWGSRSLEKFHLDAFKRLDLISTQPFMYKASLVDQRTRVGRIGKFTSFLYEVHNDHIRILCFMDNRHEPLIDDYRHL